VHCGQRNNIGKSTPRKEWSKLMSNNKLFQIAGWCALVTGLLMLAFHVFPGGAPASLGLILSIATLLGLTVVFYALFVAHRPESATLSLAGLILWLVVFVLNLIGMVANSTNTFLSNVSSLLWALPFLIFGYLAYRSTRLTRGLAVLALLSGAVALVLGIAGFMGSAAIVDGGNLVLDILMLAWIVWLGIFFLSKKFAAA
jgi:hypothetical protein